MVLRTLSAVGLLVVFAGCKRHGVAKVEAPAPPHDEAGVGPVAAASDAADANAEADAAQPSVRIAALDVITPVCSAPEWPPRDPSKASDERIGVIRLGYLRKGDQVDAKPDVIKKPNCPEGWYELIEGGFVCGKYATVDLSSKELADAPHPPFTDSPLPYDYGLNLTTGAPLYRRRPLRKERQQYERGLQVGKSKPAAQGDEGDTNPAIASAAAPTAAPASAPATGGAPPSGETPWYLQSDGRKKVTLDEMRDTEGPVAERMARGFYLALDTRVSFFAGRFWRTTRGLYAASDHILVHKSTTEFEGVHVDDPDERRKLPIAFVLGIHARTYTIDGEHARRGDHEDRFSVVGLTGKKQAVEDRTYYETIDGWWMRDIDGTVTRPGPPPPDLAPGEKWIDVNLSTQSLVAFEGDKPVYATILSSGRHDDNDKAKDHRTILGSFRIREKHVSATMDADNATDGPYSIEDVPWIMYFEASYALHGAFWHSSFGHERSHGCVNLTPHDAKFLFSWAGPTLPAGWHGVRATNANPGTRVIVHE
jgi:hypothetical protein